MKDNVEEQVLSLLSTCRECPITGQRIREHVGISSRDLRKVMTRLRETYPICSSYTAPYGYWIADNEDDLIIYVEQLKAHIRGLTVTLVRAKSHLATLRLERG